MSCRFFLLCLEFRWEEGLEEASADERVLTGVHAIESAESVKKTTSGDELYLDSYERYAENRPNTSQVREAINSGGGLP